MWCKKDNKCPVLTVQGGGVPASQPTGPAAAWGPAGVEGSGELRGGGSWVVCWQAGRQAGWVGVGGWVGGWRSWKV